MAGCVFCGIAAGRVPATIVMEDERTVAFEDLNPMAPVHVLVIPREHTVSVSDIGGDGLLDAIMSTGHRVAERKGVVSSGYRLVFNLGPDAGQSVYHTHLHVLGGRRLGWPPG